jgi:hypothetical protein
VGNEDTFKEMMRVLRTVESKFSILPPTLEKVEMQLEKQEIEKQEEIKLNEKYAAELQKHQVPIDA